MFNTPEEDALTLNEMRPRDGNGRLQGDEKLKVQFSRKAVHSPLKSEQEGRPIFTDADFVTILVPGDPFNMIQTLADASHKDRFPREWEAYVNKTSTEKVGTPLVASQGIASPSQIAELKFLNVTLVEELADLNDGDAGNLRGGNALKQRAAEFLKRAEAAAAEQRIAAVEKAVADKPAKK